jgi:DHA1 family L-arabinose/isopropyl-beta-D-thiogalactopyranoside export protein-like MFS transporter
VFNTSEFVPIGLLTDIGASFSLAEEGAAVMISVYAWGVMLMSLPLMVLASRVGFRRLMLGLLALFATGQFLCAVAPTFWLLVAARLLVAAAHSVFWAVVMVVAARVVDPRASSAAIGLVATGSSIAQIVGMPLGRAIGLALGWRMTFAAMGVASVSTLAYLAVVFPSMGPGERFGLWGSCRGSFATGRSWVCTWWRSSWRRDSLRRTATWSRSCCA